MTSFISKIHARQILDSRGNPTIECDVTLANGVVGRAAVPSGASTGSKEALELRDENPKEYLGKTVHMACKNINSIIAPLLIGKNVEDQKLLDQLMIECDGTENKSKLGANAILGVSLAASRAGALHTKKSLFRYLRENLQAPIWNKSIHLPMPLMNVINGGAHATNNLNVQEFMIVPHLNKPFSENLRAGMEVFHHLKKVMTKKNYATGVGDEGGFAPNLNSNREALELLMQAIEVAGYKPGIDFSLAMDVAASEFFDESTKTYLFENKKRTSLEMIEYYEKLMNEFPFYSIEDGMSEGDFSGWKKLTEKLGKKILIIGDDLFVTNKKILQEGISAQWANSILIKVNQIGTLTETFETLDLAQKNQMKSIISHRSGETADSFIADLAVATSCGHIKTGSGCRSDRLEKYNQLLRIEEELGSSAIYVGKGN